MYVNTEETVQSSFLMFIGYIKISVADEKIRDFLHMIGNLI